MPRCQAGNDTNRRNSSGLASLSSDATSELDLELFEGSPLESNEDTSGESYDKDPVGGVEGGEWEETDEVVWCDGEGELDESGEHLDIDGKREEENFKCCDRRAPLYRGVIFIRR